MVPLIGGGIQMDETALPIMLVDFARREKSLGQREQKRLWPMVKRAASFIARNVLFTQQDRWEEDQSYSPFTLAAEIAALLCTADLADLNDDNKIADYYVRIAPPEVSDASSPAGGFVTIKNRSEKMGRN